MKADPLISVDVLQTKLQEPDWIVCDCRFELSNPNAGSEQYRAGHIPSAIYIDLERHLSADTTGNNGRHPLPEADTLSQTLAELGISNNASIVAYDSDGGVYASRLWWSLRYLGHPDVFVLNGGMPAWEAAGLSMKSGEETRSRSSFHHSPQENFQLGLNQILSLGSSMDDQLLDARAPERFRGSEEPIDLVAGHIPGALNYDWHSSLDDKGFFKSGDVLQAQLIEVLGETSSERVIAYCGSGVSACHVLLAMEIAGMHGARLYPGSWSEWSADPSRPIVRDG